MIFRINLLFVGFLLVFSNMDGAPDPLKIRQPNWRIKTLASFPEGGIQKIVFFEPSTHEDVDIPVKAVTYFEDGKMQSETDLLVLSNDDPIAKQVGTTVVPHGFSITYWPQGVPSKVMIYEKGVLNGNFSVYDETAALVEKGTYRQGLLSGNLERFNRDGTRSFLGHYQDGVLHGELMEWHPNGVIKSIQYYNLGLLSGDRQRPALRNYNVNRTLIETRDFRFGRPYGVMDGKSGFLLDGSDDKKNEQFEPLDSPTESSNDLSEEMKHLNGEWRVYYPPKAGESEGELKQILNYKEGDFHGVQKAFYPNGQINTLITYRDGILHGQKAYWDNQGILLEEAFYQDGDLEGRYYQRKSDGAETISHYRHHRLHGLEQMFYPNNSGSENKVKAREVTYVDGLLDGELTLYNREGIKVANSNYRKGLREGISTIYSVDGRVLMTAEYQNDKKNGLAYQYFPNGTVQQQNAFINDLEEGEEKVFFENGEVSALRPFSQGKLNGTAKEWDKEGKLIFQADYKEGKRHGCFLKYNPVNNCWVDQSYDNDILRKKS